MYKSVFKAAGGSRRTLWIQFSHYFCILGKKSQQTLSSGWTHRKQHIYLTFLLPCLSEIILRFTDWQKSKFAARNETHEYWLDSFLPISGQLIFWRSILMMQMNRIKFTCGETRTLSQFEFFFTENHCSCADQCTCVFMRSRAARLMRRRAVGPTADPDAEEHNKTCCVDTAGRQRESALTGGPRPALSSFFTISCLQEIFSYFSWHYQLVPAFLTWLFFFFFFSHYVDMIDDYLSQNKDTMF